MDKELSAVAFILMCYMQHRNNATLLLHATPLRCKLTSVDVSNYTVSICIYKLKVESDASRSGRHKTCLEIMQQGPFGSHPASLMLFHIR
jgi:hypothetical protein